MKDVKTFKGAWVKVALMALACVSVSAHAGRAVNVAPTISGTPATTTTVGQSYAFQPTASDANGDKLRFVVVNKPVWATFDPTTGRLAGKPAESNAGTYANITIRVTDGKFYRSLPNFSITVKKPVVARKANYGHYFATRYADTPQDVAMLCGQDGVKGVVWRRTWAEVEPAQGVYDFSSYDEVLQAIAASHNPQCQVWLFIEIKSFDASPVPNPCPDYLKAQYSGPNAHGHGASTCFMWEPVVYNAYIKMMKAAAARYNANPRVEGFIFQESALGFNGQYSQDVSAGGTYTAEKFRDALVEMVSQCGAAWSNSRCLAFLNFIKGGQQYLHDVSRALAAIPNNRGCISGPDLLPDSGSLHQGENAVYQVLTKHQGCRSNSAQNDSFAIPNYDVGQVFNFAVRGEFGQFNSQAPRSSGVCVNSYLFWNHRVAVSSTGQDWTSALPVISAYPYGRLWLDQCQGGGTAP